MARQDPGPRRSSDLKRRQRRAQSAVRVATAASPATGGRCPLRLGAGAGLVPRDGISRPPGRPAPGRHRAPTCGLAQPAGYLLCQAKPG